MSEYRTIPQDFFVSDPIVYAVGNEYCIVFNSLIEGMGWIEVNGEIYVEEHNGNIVSDLKVHKNYVPMSVLDKAGVYDIVFTPVYARKAYFAQTGEEQRKTYKFKAPDTKKENFNIYHISDTHSSIKYPVMTAEYFGDDLDLLIMNGDIPNHCGDMSHILALFELASKITHGEIPVVFSRGNHDTRGAMALHYDMYTPTSKTGKTYYTFRIGKIWGLVLDCGEDKIDKHPEYGGLAWFEPWRKKETEWLREVVQSEEYNDEGIETRMVICHINLDVKWNEFQREIYTEWISLINKINPDVVLYGHCHKVEFTEGGAETIFGKMNPPTIIGGDPRGDDFKGLALTLNKDGYIARFTNKDKNILEEHVIEFAKKG